MPYSDPRKQLEYQNEWVKRRREMFLLNKSCETCGETEDLTLVRPGSGSEKVLWSASAAKRVSLLRNSKILCYTCWKEHHGYHRHGTWSNYKRGCRCDDCVAVFRKKQRDHMRGWRAMKKVKELLNDA